MKKKIKAVGFLGQRKKTGFWYTFSGSLERILKASHHTKNCSFFGMQP
jgi:hypothetical protein